MKKIIGFVLVLGISLSSCSTPKPYYQTSIGKKKQKYYNKIQFGGESASTMKKSF